jgi:hypothetical protein
MTAAVNIVTCRPVAGQRLSKHVPAEGNSEYAGNNWITSISMQHAVNTTIEEAVFSMWFAYIHCWAMDVSSKGPPQDYISSPVLNQKSVVELRIRTIMESLLGSQGRRVQRKIDCSYFDFVSY